MTMQAIALAPAVAAESATKPANINHMRESVAFSAERSSRTHSFSLSLPVSEAIVLFTPEGEKRWADGWNPRYLAPSSGKTTEGMVFTTDHGGAHTIWTLVRYQPQQGLVEYVRDTPGSRTGTVRVQCEATDAHLTRVQVTYIFTGLSEAGNTYIREFDEKQYVEYIDSWGTDIAKALQLRTN